MRCLIVAAMAVMTFSALGESKVAYECFPETPHHFYKSVKIVEENGQDYMELTDVEEDITKFKVEYGDDMDSIYYVSEEKDMQLWFWWSDMHEDSEAPGELVLNWQTNEKPREDIPVLCFRKN